LALEVLHLALMFLGGGTRFERAKVAALARLWIDLARIEAIAACR
jgi:hypothetical protein